MVSFQNCDRDNLHRIASSLKLVIPLLVCFLSATPVFSQKHTIHGIVKDEVTQSPVADVDIKINGTNRGAVTDKDGRFTLILDKVPSSVTLSCIGYEMVYYDIIKTSSKSLELIMRPRVYSLKEVEISAERFRYVFRDMSYSVLDYEIMDDNLLLLVFRGNLKRTELILLTLTGDTISIIPVPEQKPSKLYKDFLGNIHYVSTRGNAYQCYYNDTLKQFGFVCKTTYDSLLRAVKPFVFMATDRFYFQEFTPDGFGTNIGFYDKEHKKNYVRYISGETSRRKYFDDVKFYNLWNDQLQNSAAQLSAKGNTERKNQAVTIDPQMENPARYSEDDFHATKKFYGGKINAPIVKLGENNMAIFNFSEDKIEMMDQNGKVYKTVPISFHKDIDDNPLSSLFSAFIPVEWKWRGNIIVDEYFRCAYTIFQKNWITQLKKIDVETGNLTTSYELPFAFPEKIRIYKGVAYFLLLGVGQNENWKLARFKLL